MKKINKVVHCHDMQEIYYGKQISFDDDGEVPNEWSVQGRSVSARCAPDVDLTTQVLHLR